MINYADKALFEQTSIDKQFHIYTDNESVSITNRDLFLGEFVLNESLCSEENLRFGSCESSGIQFTAANNFDSLKGKWINVEIELHGAEEPFFLGRYKVFSDKPTSHRARREVVAYDALYDVLNEDYTEWYQNLWISGVATMTVKQFRDAFFNHIGITQETISLLNDNFIIENAVDSGNTISGKTILNSICEWNGVFGHIGRDNVFHYISLESLTTYPIANSQQIESDYEEFVTKEIDSIAVYSSNGSLVATVGDQTAENRYTITGNILLFNQETSLIITAAQNLLAKIDSISYRAFSGEFNGNPCYEVGDSISFSNGSGTITTIILERVMSGIQSLRDSYTANGTETYVVDANSTTALKNSLIKQINDVKSLDKTSMQTYIYRNFNAVAVEDEESEDLLTMEFVTVDTAAVIFDIQVCLEIETTYEDPGTSGEYDTFGSAVGMASYILDGIDLREYPTETWDDGKHILTLHLAFPSITVSRHTLTLNLSMSGGRATIHINDILVILTGNGLLPNDAWDGIITASDEIPYHEFNGYIQDFTDSATCDLVNVATRTPSDSLPMLTFSNYLMGVSDRLETETDLMIFTTQVNLGYLTYTATITNNRFINGEVILPKMSGVIANRIHGSNVTFYVSFDDGVTWLAYTLLSGWTEGTSMTIAEFESLPVTAWDPAYGNPIIKAIMVDDAYLQEIDTIGGVPVPPED